jgi:hypothetical protein
LTLQRRIPGTVPALQKARKAHREAIAAERELEDQLDAHKETAKEIREAFKLAKKKRRAAEDDLAASEAIEAAEKGEALP